MQITRTPHFKKEFQKLPTDIQVRAAKTIQLFVADQSHPSIRLKKMQGKENRWEIRVTISYRIIFEKMTDGILMRHIGKHDILRKE